MYNDFVLVGPKTDQKECSSIEEKLIEIAINKLIPKKGLKLVHTPKANPNAISCGEALRCFNLLI